MERILSRDEIAELLSAVKDGSLDSELAPDEDYSEKPRAVSGFSLVQNKGQSGLRLANFDILLDAFSRNMSFSLSSRLQRAVSILRENIGSMDYESLINECSNHQLYGIITLDPLKKNGLLIFDANIAFAQVEIMLGGGGPEQGVVTPNRGMTSIEINIVKEVVSEGCQELNKAFSAIEPLASELVRVEANPRLVTIVPGDTEIMVASFKVKIDDTVGLMRLAIPYSSLDPIREKLKSELGAASSGSQWGGYFADEVQEMDVAVSAQLAQIQLDVRDILDLRVGDILPLGCPPDSPVTLQVEGHSKFTGLIGLRDGKKALRIIDKVKKRR
ncbi:MAG: FliM/FliN family flagellar motor switch protein [Deltaproteobacteria bacterium]|nr:FliM/FliN family flagellar motor switch protein [Deltaproteobacteria bacterium]